MDLEDPVLDAYEREHAESAADWRQLETKVAATVVMAGAFLAGVIAMVGKPLGALVLIEVATAALALLSLFAGIITAVSALRTREIQMPPDGNTVASLLAQASRRSLASDADRRVVVIRALRLHWYRAAAELQDGNSRKGDALVIAQRLVLLGGLLAATFAVLRLVAASQAMTG